MAYDIAAAFEAVEEELIASMIRNLKRHRAEETELGYQWTQWQVEQLAALEEYRRRNRSKFSRQFSQIHKVVGDLINAARDDGHMHQEEVILKAIRDGARLHKSPDGQMVGQFFRMNDQKMNALIRATQDDFQAAERAMLRRADDQYRQVIFNSMVYANSGAGTYEKAVDMATRDFLRAGINCVQYKNGARHTLKDYADMAIKTATKRAYLTGEGEKRQEWGIALVIVNKRTDACPKCLPFSGKVMIDDVWSGGKPDGKHMLISTAMSKGLYHPRCRDSHTTYFPGISSAPDKGWTKEELEALEKDEIKREKLIYAENQAEKYERMARHSLDEENRQKARHRANQWKEQAAPFTPAKTIEEAQAYAQKFCQKSFMNRAFKGEVNFKGVSLEHANAINRSLTEVYNRFPDLDKLSGIKAVAPGSARGKKAFKSGADALFSYSPVEHGIFINKDILKGPKVLDEYMKRSEDAYNLVMANIDKLSGRQRDLAERYAKAGRELVSGDTVEGLFTHELGHHVQWTMLDPKTTNSLTSRMSQYAPHLSGYATSSNSEYLAESFAAYMKGEQNLLDPEYVEYLQSKSKIESMKPSIRRASEPIKGFHALHENLVVDTMRKEYDPWIAMLSKDEKHAIRKYTKNSLKEEKENKFYQRLNAMLRGDLPEDPYMRGYADTISLALKKQPLQEDIICFRNMSVDPFSGVEVGGIAPARQFFSTSVIRSRTMKGEYELSIWVPKGSYGAYIEKLSRVPSQREFLIDKDCEYRVLSRKGKRILLEVVI